MSIGSLFGKPRAPFGQFLQFVIVPGDESLLLRSVPAFDLALYGDGVGDGLKPLAPYQFHWPARRSVAAKRP